MKIKQVGWMMAVLAGCFWGGQTAWAADGVAVPDRVSQAGTLQMNRMQQYMERERVNRQIAEDRAAHQKQLEQKQQEENKPTEEIHFLLKQMQVDPSAVLSEKEIQGITAPYEGKEVTLQDIYQAVEKINALYSEKGYATCRAFLPPQTVEEGTVHILLVEGKTEDTTVVNNQQIKADYIKKRLSLKEGDVANLKQLNQELLRFNGTNTTQLRIVMKAGKAPGTTDYEIVAYEPKRTTWTLFEDNAGSDTSGIYRTGLFYSNKSLSGVGDALGVGTVISEGTRAANATYSHYLGRRGTKMNFLYSTNAVKTVDGAYKDMVKGHANAFAIGFTHPLVVNEKKRIELSLDYNHQNSKSDFMVKDTRFNIVNDTVQDVTFGLALTNYGNTHVLYRKHSFVMGESDSKPGASKAASQHFHFYKFNGLYQKSYAPGRVLSIRTDAQWSPIDGMVSARQYYIGGMYSVRGYKENYLGGDSGFTFSTEYQMPIGHRDTYGFTFFDYGRIYMSGQSANIDKSLSSVGFGVRQQIGKNYSASLHFGFPLKRDFQAEKVSPMRVHFVLSGQF